jgi:hypothetical protein
MRRILPLPLAGEGIGAVEVPLRDLHALRVSPATVERDWKFARAWLYRAVSGASS